MENNTHVLLVLLLCSRGAFNGLVLGVLVTVREGQRSKVIPLLLIPFYLRLSRVFFYPPFLFLKCV